jgi:hypothetical protein
VKKSYWLLAIGFWLLPALAGADSTVTDRSVAPRQETALLPRPWWVGVWAGAARRSPFETRQGERRRDFYVAAIRIGKELDTSPRFAYDYYMDVIPLLQQTKIPVEYRTVNSCAGRPPSPGELCNVETVMITETVSGFGVTPLGLQMRMWPASRFQLAFGLSMGLVLYDKPLPDPGERRLNFMGDLSAGLQVRVGRSGQLLAGLRQNHTSNGGTGEVNPGLDSRVLYFGATRSLGRQSQR